MEALSARYGWTVQQIRDTPVEDITQYLRIMSELNAIEKFNAMKRRN